MNLPVLFFWKGGIVTASRKKKEKGHYMNIAIYGGGNIGTQFAAHFAEAGNEVTMFTSKPEKFAEHLTVVDKQGNVIHKGNLKLATNDPKKAFSNADVIFITVPSFAMKKAADIATHFFKNSAIGGFISLCG